MKKVLPGLVALAVALGIGGQARAAVITYWNMNVDTWTGVSNFTIPSNPPSFFPGTITSNYQGSDTGALPGTTVNAVPPDPAGMALSLFDNGNLGTNGQAEEFTALSSGTASLTQMTFSFAVRSQINGLFNTGDVSFSTDGTTFSTLGTYTANNVFAVKSFLLPAGSLTAPQVFVRITPTTSAASGAAILFDNVRFDGAVVPEPASFALTGLGLSAVIGGWFFRRRRQPNAVAAA